MYDLILMCRPEILLSGFAVYMKHAAGKGL